MSRKRKKREEKNLYYAWAIAQEYVEEDSHPRMHFRHSP